MTDDPMAREITFNLHVCLVKLAAHVHILVFKRQGFIFLARMVLFLTLLHLAMVSLVQHVFFISWPGLTAVVQCCAVTHCRGILHHPFDIAPSGIHWFSTSFRRLVKLS